MKNETAQLALAVDHVFSLFNAGRTRADSFVFDAMARMLAHTRQFDRLITFLDAASQDYGVKAVSAYGGQSLLTQLASQGAVCIYTLIVLNPLSFSLQNQRKAIKTCAQYNSSIFMCIPHVL